MIIGIDASRISKAQKTGVESYSAHLLDWFKKLDKSYYEGGVTKHDQYLLFTPSASGIEFMDLPENFVVREIPFPRLWTQLRLSFQLFREKMDVLFVPSHVMPFFAPKNLKKVVTIHDVAFRYFPESYGFFSRIYLDMTTRYAVKRADKILTISSTTRDDLIKFYDADRNKIEVIYLGFDTIDRDSDLDKKTWEATKEKFGINKKFLLYIGRIESKKNILNLVKSFYQVLTSGEDLQLVLAGGRGVGFEKIEEFVKKYNLSDRVIFTGFVREEEKSHLLENAEAFVFISRYEGFGIPVLEAFEAGLPVIASKIDVFKELYKGAVVFVDQYDTNQISKAMVGLLKSNEKQKEMVKKGRAVLKKFSWEKCAKETIRAIKGLGEGDR